MAWNANAIKTPAGFLKLCHVALGAICLALPSSYSVADMVHFEKIVVMPKEVFVFILVSFACLFTSLLLLVSFFNEECAENLKKSVFEFLYHLFAFLFYISTTIALIVLVAKIPKLERNGGHYAAIVATTVCGVLNSILYAANAYFGYKSGAVYGVVN